MKYYIDYGTGAGNIEVEGTLEDALEQAQENIAYTQEDIKIFDYDEYFNNEFAKPVAISKWEKVPATDKDFLKIADFGDNGFYQPFTDGQTGELIDITTDFKVKYLAGLYPNINADGLYPRVNADDIRKLPEYKINEIYQLDKFYNYEEETIEALKTAIEENSRHPLMTTEFLKSTVEKVNKGELATNDYMKLKELGTLLAQTTREIYDGDQHITDYKELYRYGAEYYKVNYSDYYSENIDYDIKEINREQALEIVKNTGCNSYTEKHGGYGWTDYENIVTEEGIDEFPEISVENQKKSENKKKSDIERD